ncbi:hypothetical protein IJT93_11195 [bacterium]|nr:hypothetical protein [bacterium]
MRKNKCFLTITALVLGMAVWSAPVLSGEDGPKIPINDDAGVYVPDEPAVRHTDYEYYGEVSQEDRAAVNLIIKELYDAYLAKDFSKVYKLSHKYYENSAAEYASRHQDNSDAYKDIIEAYEAFHTDVFNHEDYKLSPFTLEFCSYRKLKDGNIEVSSPVPVILSSSLDFKEETEETIHYMTVAVRLGRFVFAPCEGGWQIVEMDLY